MILDQKSQRNKKTSLVPLVRRSQLTIRKVDGSLESSQLHNASHELDKTTRWRIEEEILKLL